MNKNLSENMRPKVEKLIVDARRDLLKEVVRMVEHTATDNRFSRSQQAAILGFARAMEDQAERIANVFKGQKDD